MDNKHLNNILNDLNIRDIKDAETDQENREKFETEGLKLIKPGKTITIDTGKIIGVENVVDVIIKEIDPSIHIISIEGVSGTGKSATADSLHHRLGTIKLSFGEIFRYLTYRTIQDPNVNYQNIFKNLNYKIEGDKIYLYDDNVNVSVKHSADLREKELEDLLPHIAAKIQKNVISFTASEIERLRTNLKKIVLLEGRGYTLDFLPSDLRIKLVADPKIRAERRLAQEFKKQ